ncbi:MAG: VOC family protein [Ignavibacteria bacterium]|nr:VOC family protein [Ignavibacteria bacterium]
MNKITPFLWFDDNLEEAMNYYTSIFKNSKVTNVNKMPDGKYMVASFEIEGQKFQAINGGPMFKFTEAISMSVDCKDQEEVDYYWNKLTCNGGAESQCGWLKDKYGLSWQIIPRRLIELMGDKNPAKAKRVMDEMLKMKKIIVKDLEDAYNEK